MDAPKATLEILPKKYTNLMLVKDVFVFLKPYKSALIFASIARAIGDMAWLFPAYALASTVNFFTVWKPGDSLQWFYTLMGLWAVSIVLRFTGQYLAKFYGFQASERAALSARLTTIRHLFALDGAWHEKENAGNKLKRIESGAESLNKIVRIWITNLIEIGVSFVGIVFILAAFDLKMSLGFVIFIVIFYLLSSSLIRRASSAAKEVNAKEEEMSGLFFEAVNNVRSAKVLGMTDSLMEAMKTSAEEVFGKVRTRIYHFQFRSLMLGFTTGTFRLMGISYIVYGIMNGHYEVGFLLIFNGYFNRIQESVNELSEVAQDLVVAKHSIKRMQEVLDTSVDNEEGPEKRNLADDWQKITVKNLSFSYGGHQVLDRVSFEIHRGERIGIVGLSGAGKSTLFKLLLKENESYAGEILFDDILLKDIKKKSYYKRAAIVLQDTEVFNFKLRDNITIVNPGEGKNKVFLERALSTAHVADFVSRLPLGLDTLIGEKGVKLSGGERQRLGIARAIFKDPQILFMDEATSHLDLESEEKIQDSLHKFFQKVTAVVIAHRLTTIKEMDRILVLEGGKLIESGTFDELFKQGGRFFELWEKQKLG